MGVSGCGKSTVGDALAQRLGLPFLDGDQFHPAANVAKMKSGQSLTDEDRWPWLDALGRAIGAEPNGVVAACSALKRSYRDRLIAAAGKPLFFVHLAGSPELIAARMAKRPHHFMPTTLLDSQFATLEPPTADERAISIGIEAPVDQIVAAIEDRMRSAT